jgi:hypothetical protein
VLRLQGNADDNRRRTFTPLTRLRDSRSLLAGENDALLPAFNPAPPAFFVRQPRTSPKKMPHTALGLDGALKSKLL